MGGTWTQTQISTWLASVPIVPVSRNDHWRKLPWVDRQVCFSRRAEAAQKGSRRADKSGSGGQRRPFDTARPPLSRQAQAPQMTCPRHCKHIDTRAPWLIQLSTTHCLSTLQCRLCHSIHIFLVSPSLNATKRFCVQGEEYKNAVSVAFYHKTHNCRIHIAAQLVDWINSISVHCSAARLMVFGPPVPDLWLTGDHFVGKLSAMGQPTRPTQPSISQGRTSSNQGWWPLNGQPGLRMAVAPVWLTFLCASKLPLQQFIVTVSL